MEPIVLCGAVIVLVGIWDELDGLLVQPILSWLMNRWNSHRGVTCRRTALPGNRLAVEGSRP